MLVARQVEGFDIIVSGHDHQEKVEEITNDAGHKVLIVDARSHARALGKITVSLTRHAGHYDKTYTAEFDRSGESPTGYGLSPEIHTGPESGESLYRHSHRRIYRNIIGAGRPVRSFGFYRLHT